MRWIIDGNNVVGSRPDGWWNDRPAAQHRLAQQVAEWCRSHGDAVTLVFDAPLAAATADLAGGNLDIVESTRRGRDAADHEIVDLVRALDETERSGEATTATAVPAVPAVPVVTVVTSDRGLRARLPESIRVFGAGRFRDLIGS